MTIHILSDRRPPISTSPRSAVPLLLRSGFVQSVITIARNAQAARIGVSTDGGRTRKEAKLHAPVLPKAHTRFTDWDWDGEGSFNPKLKKAAGRPEDLRTPEGEPIPPYTLAELRRDVERRRLLSDQIRQIEEARLKRSVGVSSCHRVPTGKVI